MASVEEAILPFIPSLNRGTPVDALLAPILGENPSLEESEVRKALLAHLQPTVNHVPSISKAIKPKINASRYRGETVKKYQKTMTNLQNIVDIVGNNPHGINKRGILTQMRKDNSHWRPKITRWLYELVDDGVILSDGVGRATLFYPATSQVQDRERKYHRLVAEALQVNGEMTQTQLGKHLGCGGGSNRHKVISAIQDLSNEGWIEMGSRSRWRWCL